ncbi:MAG: PRTRC system protein E [Legionellaceae bacterium]|nr:PRTRC system protein E [Legionellaceae bacterium]
MNYSDYGLDEKKISQDPDSNVRAWSCLWCNETVKAGFNLCFSNWVICRDCVETAHESERWADGVECWKCNAKDIKALGCDHAWGGGEFYICQSCIDWAKETFTKQDEFINKEREQMTTEEILLKCYVKGNNIKLPDDIQLDYKSEYAPVKKKIEKAGGRWIGRDVSAFVFKEDPNDILVALQAGESPKLIKDTPVTKEPSIPATQIVPEDNQVRIEQLKQLPDSSVRPRAFLDLTNQTLGQAINHLLQPSKKPTNPSNTEMSFFIQLAALLGQAEISLTVKAKDENLTVMIMPKGATQLEKMKPLILSGSAADLDQEFFSTVSTSIQKMSGIVSNVAEYEKSLNEAIVKTAANQDAKPVKSRSKKDPVEEAKPDLVIEGETHEQAPAAEEASEETKVDQAELDRIAAEERKGMYDGIVQRAGESFVAKDYSTALELFESAKEYAGEDASGLDEPINTCKQEIERKSKCATLITKSEEFASAKDWKNAAGAMKQARTLSDAPEEMDDQIKEYMQKALEAEMATEAQSYL